MKIAIDAMGGDHAPKEIVLGVNKAIQEFKDVEILLYGVESQINQYLQADPRVQVIHTDEVITGSDEPVKAVRRKRMHLWY